MKIAHLYYLYQIFQNGIQKKNKNMHGVFSNCSSLISLPDISKWNLENVTDLGNIFCGCKSLKSLPDISIWNTQKVKNMQSIFDGFSSLFYIPDISKWDTQNVNFFFIYSCRKIIKIFLISQ